MNDRILIIGFVWPEPTSTAAGRRMMQLIEFFKWRGNDIYFACPAAKSEFSFPLEKIGVKTLEIELNNASFDEVIQPIQPKIVIYDRFMIEEQFGWRIQNLFPEAVTILDTEDLHFLRKRRKSDVERKKGTKKNDELELREIASIYRSDLSLIISQYEMDVLSEMGIPTDILLYLPFMEDRTIAKDFNSFENRTKFLTIGSFIHAPNLDSVVYLKEKIWPLIRKKLPSAEIDIYGSYPNNKVEQLNNIVDGFYIKGRAEDALEVMSKAKVCLAPLRFGAGLKGKFIDAMRVGTPVITTSVGIEGMGGYNTWPGFFADTPEEIANKAVTLCTNEVIWNEKSQLCAKHLNKHFSKEVFFEVFKSRLFQIQAELNVHRKKQLIGRILKHNSSRSTMYMSKWIEEKNRRLKETKS